MVSPEFTGDDARQIEAVAQTTRDETQAIAQTKGESMNPEPIHENDERQIILTFSGGKDSVASWLYLTRVLKCRDVTAAYADTSWEWEGLPAYLDDLENNHGCPLVRIQPEWRDLFYDRKSPEGATEEWLSKPLTMRKLCVFKSRPPSATKRFCTSILKLAPLRRFIQSRGECILACGVRAQESAKRAQMTPWMFDDFMGRWRDMPIHDWTHEQVFAIHKQFGIPVNPLYLKGCRRVGCFPCIMARKDDIAVIAKDEGARNRVISLEKSCGKTWFAAGTASKAYQSLVDPKSGKPINTAEDVFRWALAQEPRYKEGTMFAGQDEPMNWGDDIDAPTCSSQYGLCE